MKFSACTALCASSAIVAIGAAGGVSLALDKVSTSKLLKTVLEGTAHDALFGISFDQGKGVAVGVGGSIFESSDGGLGWEPVEQSATQMALLAVDRHGDHTIAVGQRGAILVEESAGQWKAASAPDMSRLFAVSVTAAGVAVAGGEFGALIRSADGGLNWTSIAPVSWDSFINDVPGGNAQPNIYAVSVSESGDILVAGEFGVILRSRDEGKTWQAIKQGQYLSPSLFSLFQSDKGVRFAVGQKGDIERSADDGATWQQIPTKTDANLLSIAAKPGGQELVATGMRAMLHSTDGGTTWMPVIEDDTLSDWYQAVRTDLASGRIEAVGHAGKIIQIGS
ncbi:MAG: photosystem stability/assembly factor-like protein [Nevskia sp.]|nr:photosystem stability/assembly factor-like protein [Nevskia sp.]